MNPKEINSIDWQKIALAIAVGISFILQSWHSMQLTEMKEVVVPRVEYEKRHEKVMDKDEILAALKMLNQRLNSMEVNNAN